MAHLLIARSAVAGAPDDGDVSGPLVVDLDELAQHRKSCADCSEQGVQTGPVRLVRSAPHGVLVR